MDTYATAQLTGGRSHQCDVTAVRTTPDGTRAYVLLDGIGSTATIRTWTRLTAQRLAGIAARRGDAEIALRAVHDQYAANPDRHNPWKHLPAACAVVAVTTPHRPTTIAWCGDTRAYAIRNGAAHCLTRDHNMRRVVQHQHGRPGGNRNLITSCLGSIDGDTELLRDCGHPAVEATTWPAGTFRLLLASDGAYEPIEDSGGHLSGYLVGSPAEAARNLTRAAVGAAAGHADNATALVADLAHA